MIETSDNKCSPSDPWRWPHFFLIKTTAFQRSAVSIGQESVTVKQTVWDFIETGKKLSGYLRRHA